MSCNVPFWGSPSRTFPPTLSQRESLRLQNYTKKMTYARAYVIFLYFFMYVVCLFFYVIGWLNLFLYLSFSFPGVLGSTVSERDDYFILPSVGSVVLVTLPCSANTIGNALQISGTNHCWFDVSIHEQTNSPALLGSYKTASPTHHRISAIPSSDSSSIFQTLSGLFEYVKSSPILGLIPLISRSSVGGSYKQFFRHSPLWSFIY